MKSKALKNSEKQHSKLYLWWIESNLSSFYYNWTDKLIHNPIYQTKRLIQWYINVFRHDYDLGEQLLVYTLEGTMEVSKGDWIICGINGELYPCKPDIFEKTYESVED